MKKELKKPITERVIQLLMDKLNKLGRDNDEKILIIEQSLRNGWADVYELKGGYNNYSRKTFHPDDFLNV